MSPPPWEKWLIVLYDISFGFLFQAVNLEHYNTYLENYPNAIATVKKCCTENPSFNDLVKVSITSSFYTFCV